MSTGFLVFILLIIIGKCSYIRIDVETDLEPVRLDDIPEEQNEVDTALSEIISKLSATDSQPLETYIQIMHHTK